MTSARDRGRNESRADRVPGLTIVRLFSRLVPAFRRPEWIAEWEGELHHAWGRRPTPLHDTRLRVRLTIRSLGAIADALWLRRHHGVNDMLGTDLRYALRTMRRRPGFATIVVLTLALGIGATTAIFSVVNAVLLRPLPYPDAEQLVIVRGTPTDGDPEKVGAAQSYPDFEDYRSGTRSFAGLAAMRSHPTTLTETGREPVRVMTTYASGELWSMLRARAILGRTLLPSDDAPNAPQVGVITHELWQSRYGGDASVIGRTISLNREPVTVVGILAPELRLLQTTGVWRPLVPDALDRERGVHRLLVLGRLGDGASRATAEAELGVIARQLALQYPADNTNRGVALVPLHESIVGDTRPALLILLGAVALVLLIGCANLASLFLARASARQREIAVRAALGAGRGRLVRQFLTESFVLAITGGALGVFVAWAGMRSLIAWVPHTLPRASEIALDWPVLLFLLVISCTVGLVFGVLPGLQLRGSAAWSGTLRDGARSSTTRRARRFRQGLVVGEIALATMLVVGAGLLIQSFWKLRSGDLGFDPNGLVVAPIQLPLATYDSATKVGQFYDQLSAEMASMPGVEAVALAFEHPLSPGWTSSFAIAGRDALPRGREPEAKVRPVRPGYFRTVGVPIVAGRDIGPTDAMNAPGAVVVNEAFVRRHFPDGAALGQRLLRRAWWPDAPEEFEIVGIAADEPYNGPGQPADPATYFSHAQFPMNDMYLVVRTAGDPLDLAAGVRERVWRVDANLPVDRIASMRALLGDSYAEPRFHAALLGLFAAAALLLAAVGIFGILSYTVTERTGEIGVRMALGAERWRVVRLVVGEGLGIAFVGIAIGLAGAVAFSRVMTSVLHDTSTHEPLVLGGVALLLSLVAVLAAYVPARRASRIDPVTSLRYD